MAGVRPRGQPLLVLATLISGWVGARALAWNFLPEPAELAAVSAGEQAVPVAMPEVRRPAALVVARATAARPAGSEAPPAMARAAPEPFAPPPTVQAPLPPAVLATPVPLAPPPVGAVAEAKPTPQMMTAGGHQLLWLAAAAMMPLPAEVAARMAPRGASPSLSRWSADGWLYLRRGTADPITFPRLTGGGTYGSSQTGAVLRYRLAPADPHRPTLYLRGAAALNGTREQEVAVGFAARPLGRVPVAAMAEVRATRDGQGTTARPAVALVTELPPQKLPFGFSGEAYVQAGYVGGRAATAYVDGLMRAERPLGTVAGAEINGGGGVWGAQQRGASRVDLGPVASVRLRLGDTASARLEADWRFRVAGKAHPGSGPALTLSAGF